MRRIENPPCPRSAGPRPGSVRAFGSLRSLQGGMGYDETFMALVRAALEVRQSTSTRAMSGCDRADGSIAGIVALGQATNRHARS